MQQMTAKQMGLKTSDIIASPPPLPLLVLPLENCCHFQSHHKQHEDSLHFARNVKKKKKKDSIPHSKRKQQQKKEWSC